MLLQTFNEVQKLLSKTNGKVVGDLMTPAPVVVREISNLEDAARLFNSSSFSSVLSILFFPSTTTYSMSSTCNPEYLQLKDDISELAYLM